MPLTNYIILGKWMQPRHSDGKIQVTEVIPEINRGRALKAFISSLSKKDNEDLSDLQVIMDSQHEVFGKVK